MKIANDLKQQVESNNKNINLKNFIVKHKIDILEKELINKNREIKKLNDIINLLKNYIKSNN